MKELFSESRRLLTAKMLMDVVKFVGIASITASLIAQSVIKHPLAIGIVLGVLFLSAWFICPLKAKEGV